MLKIGKIFAFIKNGMLLAALIIALLIFVWYVKQEIGASPSANERAEYMFLSYFDAKTLRFRGVDGPSRATPMQRMVSTPPADMQKFGLGRMLQMLLFSPHSPQREYPVHVLKRSDFAGSDRKESAVYWLGHSSAIIELGGKRIIIDPVLGSASPLPFLVRRYQRAPIERSEFPRFDYVLITHNHYDHLERRTMQYIAKHSEATFIVPVGVATALQEWGIHKERIIELVWQARYSDSAIMITAEEAQHFSGRGFHDRNFTAWNSYVIEAGGKRIFWGCDGGYGEHFKRIGERYGSFDLAALEIDAWNDHWPLIHMRPEEVVQACADLHAHKLLPIHWGVFDLAWHPFSESIERLLAAVQFYPQLRSVEVLTPTMGERLLLYNDNAHAMPYWWR